MPILKILIILFILGSGIAIYYVAKKINANHRNKYPDHYDYKWGYFMGVTSIFLGGLYSLFNVILAITVSAGSGLILYSLATFLLSAVIGYYVCKKSKQAMIWVTVLSLNPIIWIINYFYIKKRRSEFI